jgi:hypothetical protein
MVERKFSKYILSAIAAALLAATAPLSFAGPIGAVGAIPGVGPMPFAGGAFNSSPGFYDNQGRMFGSSPGTPAIIGAPGAGSWAIGSVGSTLPGSSSIGSVGLTPGSSPFVEAYPGSGISSPGISSTGTISNPMAPCIPENVVSSC